MNALVAEDDPVQRATVAAALRRWGFDVTEAADGSRAWEAIQAARGPLVAVLDWQMPDLSGTELCQRVRSQLTDSSVYAILLTARTRREDVIAGLQAGADDYVTKPFDRDELYARVQCGARVLALQERLTARVAELTEALNRIRRLEGLLPICCYCKRVRGDKDYWQQVEGYLAERTNLAFSHSVCPECLEEAVKPAIAAGVSPPVRGSGRVGMPAARVRPDAGL